MRRYDWYTFALLAAPYVLFGAMVIAILYLAGGVAAEGLSSGGLK